MSLGGKKLHNDSDKCSIPECDNAAYKVTKLVTSDQYELCDVFVISHLSTREDGYPLCTTHYGELYWFLKVNMVLHVANSSQTALWVPNGLQVTLMQV